MATTNYNLPTISGASPVAIVDDYNALSNATDAALAGAISGEKTRAMAAETELANGVSNALTTANTANVSATDAKSAADKSQTTASNALTNAATAQTTADGAKSAADKAQTTADGAAANILKMAKTLVDTPFKAAGSVRKNIPELDNYRFIALTLAASSDDTVGINALLDLSFLTSPSVTVSTGGTSEDFGGDYWFVFHADISRDGNDLVFYNSHYQTYTVPALGASPTLQAGDNAYVLEIVGLV